MTKKTSLLDRALKKALFAFLILSFFYLEATLTTAAIPNSENPVLFYANEMRDDLKLTYATAIDQAKKSVLMTIYSLKDHRIINSLRNKSEEGVNVTVICDAKASAGVEKKLGPHVNLIMRASKGLMHQKILVIDEEKSWIGSANMTYSSLRMYGNLVAGLYSPELASLLLAKGHNMAAQGKCEIFPPQRFLIGGQEAEMWFLPDSAGDAELKVKQLIDSAQKTIRVAMFTWTRYDLTDAIIAAAKRGVDVKVAIDYNSSRGAGSKVVARLRDGNIPTFIGQSQTMLHHKFLYIDEELLVVGSANWTKAAFTQNDDCFIIFNDLTPAQQKKLNTLWETIATHAQLMPN